jgi:signal transduction histidine kinase
MVLSNVGLTTDLQARLDEIARRAKELRDSRQRIVLAHDAERRRLERNIHDGAQQHLVALAVKVRLARTVLDRDPPKGRETLQTLRLEVDRAIEALTSLALGIYPPALEERGIVAALEEQAQLGTVPMRVEGDGVRRHPVETEAAVYFCCLEAIQNAAKYAAPSLVTVALEEDDGQLVFVVTDDGLGFDPSATPRGSGLGNMADRLSAFGGDVEVVSAPGMGTTVRGSIPVGVGSR